MHWANQSGQGKALKDRLFSAYFTDNCDVSDMATLCDAASDSGLDRDEAAAVLTDQRFAGMVRDKERFWVERGISSVPAMVFQSKHLVSGAQGVDNYTNILRHLIEAEAETA